MSQETVTTTIDSEGEALVEAQILARRAGFALSTSTYMARIGTVVMCLTVLLWLLLREYTQLLVFASFVVPVVATAALYPVFHRRGQATLGVSLLLASFWLALALGSLLMPETLLAGVPVYVLLLIVGHLLLGNRGSTWLTGILAITYAAVIVLMKVWTPTWFSPVGESAELAISASLGAFGLLAVAAPIRLIVTGQEESFRQSQRANLEVERRATAEQEQREYLQTTIQKYVNYMAVVGQGNLAARLTLDGSDGASDDPLITLGRQLNETVGNLQGMILQIRDAANNLSSATAEILAATTQQATGANEQSAAITQTSTTVDEARTISEQVIQRAQNVVDASQRTVETSRAGQQAVQETIDSMAQIKDRVASIAGNILALSEQTLQIGEIITTVNDIAAQSNLLALNASVEAARAGEHGKGFAVVAAEVRNLAEQSSRATEQVKAILRNIQNGINATVIATEEGAEAVDQGLKLAAKTEEVIEQLADAIVEAAQVATQMRAGGQQQATGMDQIALAMQNINQAMAQNLTSTHQTERAAQGLNDLACSLSKSVEQHQL